MSAPADEELTAARRAFDAAYQRMIERVKPEELRDELGPMLQHRPAGLHRADDAGDQISGRRPISAGVTLARLRHET